MSPHSLAKSLLWRIPGPKFVRFLKHYVAPRLVTGRQVPYAAREFFESWHRSLPGDVSDSETIAPGRGALDTRYHYNLVENGILQQLARERLHQPQVLDVGSGAGHWVDFYRDVVGASSVTALEISRVAATALRTRHADAFDVSVITADVSDASVDLGGPYRIINAIGVMFHIVEDDRWLAAVATLARHLEPGGLMIVGGQFGHITQNVQFHRTDRFSGWDERNEAKSADVALVNKRIRSLRRWRQAAARAGLRVERVERTSNSRIFRTPENNLLFLRRPAG